MASVPLLLVCALLGGARALSVDWRALDQLARAGDVRIAIRRLTDTVVDAETGQRGYLLTNDSLFLRTYDRAVASCASRLDDVRRLTASEPTQKANLTALERRVPDKLRELVETMRAHAAGESDGPLAARMLGGREIMDDIRRLSAAMQLEQERLVAVRAQEMKDRVRGSLVLFGVSSLALMLLASFAWIRRTRADERAMAFERIAAEREASIRLAEEFIAILGHDLRNPLGAVSMGSRLLATTLQGREREIADRIHHSADRMNRMVEQLLDLARSRAGGGIPVAMAPVNVSEIVSNVVSELRTARPDRMIEWALAEEIVGAGDVDRLSQLVSNLIGNALVHGDAARPVVVRLRRTGACVELEVHNFGTSIDVARLPQLFEPYQQGRVKTKSQGLGLGLFISHEIARAHGGDIRVRSSPDEGTTFTAWLPTIPSAPGISPS